MLGGEVRVVVDAAVHGSALARMLAMVRGDDSGCERCSGIAGPMTGRIVASIITGPMPNIDVTPYRADRF